MLEGTHVFEGKRTTLREVREFQAGEKPGLVSSTEAGDGYSSDELSFLGYVSIRRQVKFTTLRQEGNEAANELSFRGDWGRMPIGSKVGYTLASRSTYTSTGTLPQQTNTSECQIINSISAAVLHPALKGDAKLMECRGLQDQYKQVFKVYFLQDYSYLIALESSETKFSFFSKKITSVEQN
ncbi:hypothetical protein ACQ858_13600 [Variovorax ureilyticus]|uniref:hypothetical protein n=1 Tax=Variovorax ureilyticus TaxID=1836198 RepID=UPI003D67BA1D